MYTTDLILNNHIKVGNYNKEILQGRKIENIGIRLNKDLYLCIFVERKDRNTKNFKIELGVINTKSKPDCLISYIINHYDNGKRVVNKIRVRNSENEYVSEKGKVIRNDDKIEIQLNIKNDKINSIFETIKFISDITDDKIIIKNNNYEHEGILGLVVIKDEFIHSTKKEQHIGYLVDFTDDKIKIVTDKLANSDSNYWVDRINYNIFKLK